MSWRIEAALRLIDHAAALDAVGLRDLAEGPVLAEVALDQPGDPLADEDLGGPSRPPICHSARDA